VLGFEAIATLPLSTLPAIPPADVGDEDGAAPLWVMSAWAGVDLRRREEDEIVFLRRKTSNKAGV